MDISLITSLLLLFFLPTIRPSCVVQRNYMNVRHELRIPYRYYVNSDSYVYGLTVRCTGINFNDDSKFEDLIGSSRIATDYKNSLLVYINNSTLSTVKSGLFDPFTKAKKLFLGNIGINKIQPFSFSELENLRDLQLYDNNLQEFEANTFEGCTNLTILNLNNNKLISLKNIDIPTLLYLNVENNKISNINIENFKNLPSLGVLNISYNSISNLDSNLLTHLINLTEFSASNNQITSIPSDFFKTPMKTVDFAHNQISTINCDKFQGAVDLSYNNLINICNFYNATSIKLNNNKLSYISSSSFKNLKYLKYLELQHNNIAEVHVDAFQDLSNLTKLNISRNELNKIYIGTFHNLINLIHLDLSHNNLENFEQGVFTGLRNIVSLDLSNNQIEILDSKALYTMSELAYLNLASNYIKNIDIEQLVNHLPYLRSLNIDVGKISCHSLIHIMKTLRKKYIRLEKGTAVKVHNVNGIACDPNAADEDKNNSTEVENEITIGDEHYFSAFDDSNFVSIAKSMSSIHSVLVTLCVICILYLLLKSVLLVRNNFNYCRRKVHMPNCSLKLLNENE